ncbi:MAG: hypothetical protein M3Z23_18995 [Acidobacteriota bacterium]|nr:hypothetical protein [Acidobacteriota bacterium]
MTSTSATGFQNRMERTPGAPGARDRSAKRPRPYVQIFILFQFACQLALLSSAFGPLRPVFRVAAFCFSLIMLAIVPGRGRPHPSAIAARCVWAIVALSLLHPTTNSWLSGVAELAMYVAILAPVFWVPRLPLDAARLRRIFLILWAFHSISAGVGVLQVCYPGKFKMHLSTAIQGRGQDYVNDLYIRTASGEKVFRPMGLTDIPGGAASSGFYSALFGVGLLLTERRGILKALYLASMLLGMVCLYLSQVRMSMVMLGICLVTLCCVLVWRGERAKLLVMTLLVPGVLLASFSLAVAIGGKTVTRRLETLVKDRPSKVYYKNRGLYLDYTVKKLLPQYPFGAGLGRWGMINQYFGDNSDPKRKSIYVEIMWTGWLLDGGVPLIAAYVAALALAFITAIRITLIRGSDLWLAGALLVAYNVGALAATFVSPFFMAQGGMELWLLNAALFAAARGELQAKSARRPDTLFNRTGRDPRLGNWRPVQSLAKKNLA